jgi:hypothetical protein
MRYNLIGRRFGRFVVLAEGGRTKHRSILWLCLCDCGEKKEVTTGSLLSGNSCSCGCLQKERVGEATKTHGFSHLPIYRVWRSMKGRCYNLGHSSYGRYGGRGITVCERWFNSFENFYEDMGDKPSSRHQLDRINNNGSYCKENCRWVLPAENSRNTRSNHYLSFEGETLTLTDWSLLLGISRSTIKGRLDKGYSLELVFCPFNLQTGEKLVGKGKPHD